MKWSNVYGTHFTWQVLLSFTCDLLAVWGVGVGSTLGRVWGPLSAPPRWLFMALDLTLSLRLAMVPLPSGRSHPKDPSMPGEGTSFNCRGNNAIQEFCSCGFHSGKISFTSSNLHTPPTFAPGLGNLYFLRTDWGIRTGLSLWLKFT